MKRTKKRNKLSIQLFITTFLVMTIIISVIMLLQYLFFDFLYENYKINQISAKIEKLSEKIEAGELGLVDLKMIQDEFIFNHNTFISILDEGGNDYANKLKEKQNWYTITALTSDNAEISFTISEYELYSKTIRDISYNDYFNDDIIKVGDEFNIFFDYISENKVIINLMLEMSENPAEELLSSNGTTITITKILDATQSEINEYNTFNSLPISIVSSGVLFVDASAGVNDITKMKTIEKEITDAENNNLVIRAFLSLKSVDDAAAALLSYYPYFLSLAIICAITISFLYSKKVSKPIIKISTISNKMSKLDFSETVKVEINNEIGQLGNDLNILADSLKTSLCDLENANKQLIKDIEKKKEQEMARKEFVDNVSHELKTPLGIIRCYAESLKDDIISKPKAEYYDDILEEVDKMTNLVMEMLELSKVESGDLKLNKTNIKIRDIINDNVLLYQPSANDKNMNILVKGVYPTMYADANKIDSAISNIIKNAVNYGEEFTEILINCSITEGKNKVSITNKCKGISQYEAEKFFERFYVGDKSRNKTSSGIGLSICAGIFKAHDFNYGILSENEYITVWFKY